MPGSLSSCPVSLFVATTGDEGQTVSLQLGFSSVRRAGNHQTQEKWSDLLDS